MQEKYDVKLSPDQEKEFMEYLINKKLMALEAREKGYGEKNDVKIKYEWDFDDIVSRNFYKDNVEIKSKVTTSEARDYYNRNKGDFVEIKAQHILIKNKDLAKNIYKKISLFKMKYFFQQWKNKIENRCFVVVMLYWW